MNNLIKTMLAASAVSLATQASAQLTIYDREDFAGRSFTTSEEIRDLRRSGFNDRASSVVVRGERWEVCEDSRFSGRCAVLRPGHYPTLAAMGLNDRVSSTRAVSRNERIEERRYAPAPVAAQITFYEREGFAGRSFTTSEEIRNFGRTGFNDRASSVEVFGDRWEVCDDARFSGRCAVLRPGRYPTLAAMGLNDRVSSTRSVSRDERIEERRYAPVPVLVPAPVAVTDYRRGRDERLYEANVTSVRAVLGAQEQKCWVEREQVTVERSSSGAPGAIAGAIIGGILGHQIGGGRGKDLATVGGAIAGAAVGANATRDSGGQQVQTQDVQRCANVPSQARPEYWDVTYTFRGQEGRVQMTTPPGATITVNERGEPRS